MRLSAPECSAGVRFFFTVATLIAFLTTIFSPAAIAASPSIRPPAQPGSGPGGSQYAHVAVTEHRYGEGDLEYWLFEPAGPAPKSAPVVIFNHGWGAMTPGGYRAWIDHIVRRGNIVIYPRYQASLCTKPERFSSNAIAATKDALQRLKTESGHVQPQLDKLAVVGHSAGGLISAGMAARAGADGLPPVKAVMCVEPGKSWGPRTAQIPQDDVSTMPASTLLLALFGDRDTIVEDIDAKLIIDKTVQVPAQNKNLVKIVSDDHGSPALIANHFCPAAPAPESGLGTDATTSSEAESGGPLRKLIREGMRRRLEQSAGQRNTGSGQASDAAPSAQAVNSEPSSGNGAKSERLRSKDDSAGKEQQGGAPPTDGGNRRGLNALDYYCTWKLFDALEDAAFYGKNRDYALGNTANQRYMGKWSDGVPVKELVVQIGQSR